MIEERLRQAMRTETEGVDVDPDAWTKVQDEVTRRRRRMTGRRMALGVLAAAAVVVLAIGVTSMLDDDSRRVETIPANTTSTTQTTETTVPTTTPAEGESSVDSWPLFGIWPFVSQDEVQAYLDDPGIGMFFDAEATALEFARVYLGMPDPQVVTVSERAADDGSHLSVTVSAKPGRPMTTEVTLRRVGGPEGVGAYSVIGAVTQNIAVFLPGDEVLVTSPVRVVGKSTAFEATVAVDIRQEGQVFGEFLARSFVMGGANGEIDSFVGEIEFDTPSERIGFLVFYTESAEDGSVQEATVRRVTFEAAEG